MARVQHFGPFVALDLGAQGTQDWVLGPFPRLFESTAQVSAHAWPLRADDPGQPPTSVAQIAVTSLRSQVTPAGERFLAFTVQNTGPIHAAGYTVYATLTSAGTASAGAR